MLSKSATRSSTGSPPSKRATTSGAAPMTYNTRLTSCKDSESVLLGGNVISLVIARAAEILSEKNIGKKVDV